MDHAQFGGFLQVVEKVGGIQFPSHEATVEHLDCLVDDTVGHRMKLTIHRHLRPPTLFMSYSLTGIFACLNLCKLCRLRVRCLVSYDLVENNNFYAVRKQANRSKNKQHV
jgi:hypothetical protein